MSSNCRRVLPFLTFLALVGAEPTAQSVASPQEPDACSAGPEAAWIANAVEGWNTVRRVALKLDTAAQPSIVLFDGSCVWSGTDSSPFSATPHGGSIPVPDGSVIDAKLTSFAGTHGADDRPFMVMALPEIWRNDPRHERTRDLDRLIRGVFVHEMTHTEQARGAGVWLNALQERYTLPDNLTDDIVQERFSEAPGFREAYEAERDLFYAAAAERDPDRRGALAARAFEAMERRRSRYFIGPDTIYAALEDLFLGMEGAANWAAYRLVCGETREPSAAIDFIRRDGRRWSQDEGLAVFLVIDAMLPDWQSRAFGAAPVSVVDLLRRATAQRGEPASPSQDCR